MNSKVDLGQLPDAVEELYASIVRFTPVIIAMATVLSQYDVTEAAVRARFEQGYRFSPEELEQRHVQDNSVDGYIDRFLDQHPTFHPSRIEHTRKPFYQIVDGRDGEEKRRYRLLVSYGLSILIIDEVTCRIGEVLDSAIIDDIARQIRWKRWSHW